MNMYYRSIRSLQLDTEMKDSAITPARSLVPPSLFLFALQG